MKKRKLDEHLTPGLVPRNAPIAVDWQIHAMTPETEPATTPSISSTNTPINLDPHPQPSSSSQSHLSFRRSASLMASKPTASHPSTFAPAIDPGSPPHLAPAAVDENYGGQPSAYVPADDSSSVSIPAPAPEDHLLDEILAMHASLSAQVNGTAAQQPSTRAPNRDAAAAGTPAPSGDLKDQRDTSMLTNTQAYDPFVPQPSTQIPAFPALSGSPAQGSPGVSSLQLSANMRLLVYGQSGPSGNILPSSNGSNEFNNQSRATTNDYPAQHNGDISITNGSRNNQSAPYMIGNVATMLGRSEGILQNHASTSSGHEDEDDESDNEYAVNVAFSGTYAVICPEICAVFNANPLTVLHLGVLRDRGLGRGVWWAFFSWRTWDCIILIQNGPDHDTIDVACPLRWKLYNRETQRRYSEEHCTGFVSFAEKRGIVMTLANMPTVRGEVVIEGERDDKFDLGMGGTDAFRRKWDGFFAT